METAKPVQSPMHHQHPHHHHNHHHHPTVHQPGHTPQQESNMAGHTQQQQQTQHQTVVVNSMSDIDQSELVSIVKILQKYNFKVFLNLF